MNRLKKLLFLSFLFIGFRSNATHIVGGVIYYEYLGGDKYKLIFEIYKDCSKSVSVGYDGAGVYMAPFYFSVFEGNIDYNIYQGQNSLKIIDSIQINPIIVNPCLKPDGTCVSKGRYEKIITLPKNNVGYTIEYQRCCRNNGIANIQFQSGSNDKPGITLRTYIPPYGQYPNNSAKFKKFPPIFICVDQLFYFDHSATDADGDSLSYSLSTPLAGLSSPIPIDSIQSLKVNPCDWSPPYSLSNVLGGYPAMSINPSTGLLVCKPNSMGRFVVSIQVSEWRNGVRIDSFSRDFQYNVRDCDIPKADMPFIDGTFNPQENIGVYEIVCSKFKVDFINTSTNASSYLWKFGDPTSGSNDTSSLANPSHIYSDSGTYLVTLYAFKNVDGQLCIDSTRRYVKIYPTTRANFSIQLACAGQQMKFSDLSTSTFGQINSWKWDFGNSTTSNAQNPNQIFQDGTFQVKLTVTDSKQCIDDTTISIQVYPNPKFNATVPKGCIGQPMNLMCNVTIPPPHSIAQTLWTFPDGTQVNSCNTTLTPTSMAGGIIRLWAISDKGCQDSTFYVYVVNPLPTVKASPSVKLCYDQTTTLSAVGATNYTWTPSNYLTSPNAASTLCSLPYPNSQTYIVKGTDNNNCFNIDSTNVSFFFKTFISAGMDTSVCLNTSSAAFRDGVQLQGQGIFNSITWTPATGLNNPNILNPIAKPTSNTDYIISGVDANNCTIRDTVRVIVLDPQFNLVLSKDSFMCKYDTLHIEPIDQGLITKYSWSPTFWISNPNIRNPNFYPLDTTLYILTVQNYCYSKSDSILLNVNESPDPGLPNVDSICLGQKYQFNVPNKWNSYLWTTLDTTISSKIIPNPTCNPAITQYYRVEVRDQYNCIGRDSMQLIVHYPPSLRILGIPRYMCQGDTIPLRASTNVATQNVWKDRRYMDRDTGVLVKIFPLDTMMFQISATTISKCTTYDSFKINVQKPIVPYAKSPVRICKGKATTLSAGGGLYYIWRPPYHLNDSTISTPQVYPDSFVTYYVDISNDCFHDTLPVDVYVDTLPLVRIYQDTTIYRGTSADLIATSKASGIEWFPKYNINQPYAPQVSVSPQESTQYYVYATDSKGCIGQDSVWVYVQGKNVLLIPTGFSPNGDGINDVFRIARYLNIKTLNSFDVFNRWGQLVFSTTDITKGWDGKFNGEAAVNDVYVWKVEATTLDNLPLIQSGNVTLIR